MIGWKMRRLGLGKSFFAFSEFCGFLDGWLYSFIDLRYQSMDTRHRWWGIIRTRGCQQRRGKNLVGVFVLINEFEFFGDRKFHSWLIGGKETERFLSWSNWRVVLVRSREGRINRIRDLIIWRINIDRSISMNIFWY